MAQADNKINLSEEAVPAESLKQSTTTEMIASAESVTKKIIPAKNFTTSALATTVKKSRKTIHWICMFQLMKPLPEMIPGSSSNESAFIDDKIALTNVDAFLKDAFELFYNRDTSKGVDRRNLVLCLLGGNYVWHPVSELIAGVIVLYTRLDSVTPSLNAHLRLEKMKPLEVPSSGNYHKLYFGDCYPVHTEDVVCIQGNSLRALLRNWVNDQFFESLHWIIPPSQVEGFNSSSMRNIQVLLKKMKEEVQQSPRKTIRGDGIPAVTTTSTLGKKRKRDPDMSSYPKIWEFLKLEPGKTYPVKANHWANEDDDLPLHADGFPDMDKYRYVTYIKENGGFIEQISTRK